MPMKTDELLALPAGRELDAAVSEARGIEVRWMEPDNGCGPQGFAVTGPPDPHYYHGKPHDWRPVPAYSTDPREVVPLLEAVCGPRGWQWSIHMCGKDGYEVYLLEPDGSSAAYVVAESLPLAVCRAVLGALRGGSS